MAPIKLYGFPISTAAQRAAAALYEKDVDFEFVNVNLREKEHLQESFLSINPFGQIPALQSGDLTLFESRAITQYIVHSNPNKGTELLCQGPAMATMSVWMEVEAHQFNPPSSALAIETFYKPMRGMTVDPEKVKENEAKLCKVLDVYEKRLSESKYLAGDCFSLADLHHLPNLQVLMNNQCKSLFEDRPHVHAWVTNILARPAWLKAIALKNQ